MFLAQGAPPGAVCRRAVRIVSRYRRAMNVVQAMLETGLLDTRDIARVIGTTGRSVQRWAHGDASPRREATGRLLELKVVVDEAGWVMEPDAARQWLHSPVPALGYDKPAGSGPRPPSTAASWPP